MFLETILKCHIIETAKPKVVFTHFIKMLYNVNLYCLHGFGIKTKPEPRSLGLEKNNSPALSTCTDLWALNAVYRWKQLSGSAPSSHLWNCTLFEHWLTHRVIPSRFMSPHRCTWCLHSCFQQRIFCYSKAVHVQFCFQWEVHIYPFQSQGMFKVFNQPYRS